MKPDIIISSIVAAADNNAIGLKGDLPWHLPNDMKFYKYTTWGMPVIMGRHSYESLGSKRLPGRFNILLSKQTDLGVSESEVWVASTREKALELAITTDCKEVFVIGGAQVYALFMDITDRIYLTRVHGRPEADTFFPEPDWTQWTLSQSRPFEADARHAYAYTFETWDRKR
jgi:dihydrofolate reductase